MGTALVSYSRSRLRFQIRHPQWRWGMIVLFLVLGVGCQVSPTSAPTFNAIPTYTPTPTADIEAEYKRQVHQLALRVMELMEPMGRYLEHPAYDNPSWMRDVRGLNSQFQEAYQEALALTPPSGWEEFHESFILALKHYSNTANLLGETLDLIEGGVDRVPSTLVAKTIEEWELGQANIQQATRLLEGQPRVTAIATPSLPPLDPTSIPMPTPQPAATPGVEPVPPIPSEWLAVAESDSVRILLVEPTASWKVETADSAEAQTKMYSQVSLVIENNGDDIARVNRIWLKSVEDCLPEGRKGYSHGSLANASIVTNQGTHLPWLNISGVESPTVPGGYSNKTFFREENDVWAEQHFEEDGYYFEIFPNRWVSISAHGNWSSRVFGDCAQVTFRVNGKEVSFPLPSEG